MSAEYLEPARICAGIALAMYSSGAVFLLAGFACNRFAMRHSHSTFKRWMARSERAVSAAVVLVAIGLVSVLCVAGCVVLDWWGA